MHLSREGKHQRTESIINRLESFSSTTFFADFSAPLLSFAWLQLYCECLTFVEFLFPLLNELKEQHVSFVFVLYRIRNFSPSLSLEVHRELFTHTHQPMRHLELVLLFVTLFSVRCSCAAPRSIVPVQVVVSTLSRYTPFAIDITVDCGGYIVYVSRDLNSVYRLMHNGSSILLAGSGSSATGTANAVGSNARFYYPYGITCDVVRNIAYVSDFYNYQIRAVDLNSNGVTTLAGSAFGYFDASGTQAQFRYPNGIVYHALSGAVYVADYAGNYYTKGYIRKVVIASAVVTTLLNYDCFRLTINSHGSLIYITAPYEIVQFNVTSGAMTQLAGNGVGYFSGGVGLNTPNAVSLIEDESALLFSDSGNNIIRRLDIATKNVTTVAGSGVAGSFDGLGLNASFSGPIGGTHYCNTSSNMCGFLVADFVTGMIRFVANALLTRSVALSAEITASESHKGTSSHTPTRSPNHFSVPSSLGHSMSSSGRATASCVSGTSTISNTLTSKSPTFQFPKTGSYSFASTQSASSSPSKLHSRSFTSSCSQTQTFTLTVSRVVTPSRRTSSLSASTSATITSSPIPSGSLAALLELDIVVLGNGHVFFILHKFDVNISFAVRISIANNDSILFK